ncbi:putative alkaline shock family protein YloU [Rhodococcus sp. 27YEA15]|uniref:DUF6286 domain-containing protein n=1 Tax=Rhodococcus sp. 27YEA15 TaxID=3156259 RepID=UPI003C7CEAC3
MADVATATAVDLTKEAPVSDTDPGTRGTLVVKDRAMTKIATTAALQVPGVIRQSGGLTRLTGRELPRADVVIGKDAVAINLFLAVTWPCSVVDLTGRVRTEVGRSVETLTGLPLHEMNIMIAAADGSDPAYLAGTERTEAAEESDVVPRPPHVPSATPAAAVSAVLIAIGLLGLAFVVAREWFVHRGTYDSAPWIRNGVEWASRLHWQTWLLPTAVAAVVIGLALIVSAFKSRAKTHVALGESSNSTVWMRPTDIARLCSGHATAVPGVLSARTNVTRKRVTVNIDISGENRGELIESVTAAVRPHLDILQQPLQLSVVAHRAVESRKDAS